MKTYNWKKNIREELLNNNNLLYKIEDHSIPMIYFKLVFEDGALSETEDNRGITSLLAQMLLNGNETFPQEVVDLELDKLGASLNIASGYDYFALISRIPSKNFISFIKFLDNLLFSEIKFNSKKFDIAKSKAKSLLSRIKEHESYLSSTIFSNIVFKNQNYGLISSGNSYSLNKLKIEDLSLRLGYLKKSKHYYLIGGDYSNNDILVLKNFSKKFKTTNLKIEESIGIYSPKGFELYYYQKDGKNKVNVVIGAPSIPLKDDNISYILLFNKYFGSDFTSILAQEIREKNGWSYYANSEFSLYKYATLFTLEYAPNIENLLVSMKYLKDIFISNIDKLDNKHLDFTKKKIINSYDFKFSTTIKKLSLLSDLKLYNYPSNFFETYKSNINNLNTDKLKDKLTKLIDPNKQIVIMVGDIDSKLNELKSSKIFDSITKLENLDYLN